MKQIAKLIVLLGALLAAGSSTAFFEFCPYAGVGYKQTWIKSRPNSLNVSFSRTFPGGELFLGTKFCENFGVEIGYNWTNHKYKTTNIRGIFNGIPVSGSIRTMTRFRSFYLDIMGYIPLQNCWEFIGSIGVSSVKPTMSVQTNNLTIAGRPFFATGNILNGSEKVVWRLGVGVSYLFTECWGLRSMLRYEGTENLRINSNNSFLFNNNNHKAFRNAWSLAISVFVLF